MMPPMASELLLAAATSNWTATAFSALFLTILVVLSGLYSGSEAVLFSLTPAQLEADSRSDNPVRRTIVALMRAPQRTLMKILVGNTAVNVLLYANTYVLFHNIAAQWGTWVTPLAGVLSVLVVVTFGEVVPKVLGVSLADRLSPYSAALIHTTGYVLEPIGRVIDFAFVEPIQRLLFGRPRHSREGARPITTDELKAVVDLSRRRRLINRVEDRFLREVIDLGYLRVRDIMVPRVEVQAYDLAGGPAGLRALMRATRLKKIPVYDGAIDNIVGLIYAKMLFLPPEQTLPELVQPVHFVPEIIQCEQLLHHFRETRSQIAIVVDEYGGMAGLVTLEDVLEEIVGEIEESDDVAGRPEVVQLTDSEYDLSGGLNVHYWAELFDLPRLSERVATVGGLVTSRLGRPPTVGDHLEFANLRLTVTGVIGRRVDRLRVELTPDRQGGGAE